MKNWIRNFVCFALLLNLAFASIAWSQQQRQARQQQRVNYLNFSQEGMPSDIRTVTDSLGFRPNGNIDRLRNATITHGMIREYNSVIIDSHSGESDFIVLLRTGTATADWSTARSACQALGAGWDLPTFDRRYQVAAATRFARSYNQTGPVLDPQGRANDLFVFWLRNRNERMNQELLAGKDVAFLYTRPAEMRAVLLPRSVQFSRTQYPIWLQGDYWAGPQHQNDTTFFDFEEQRFNLTVIDIAASLFHYFTNDAPISESKRTLIDRYFQAHANMRAVAASAARTGREAMVNFVTNRMENRWEIFSDEAQYRDIVSMLYMVQIRDLWQTIQTAGVDHICMREIPKTGAQSQATRYEEEAFRGTSQGNLLNRTGRWIGNLFR